VATKEAKSSGQFVVPGLGQGGEGKSQGSNGSQSPDRRGHQDSRQNGSEIPPGEGVQRSGGPSQKEVAAIEADFPQGTEVIDASVFRPQDVCQYGGQQA